MVTTKSLKTVRSQSQKLITIVSKEQSRASLYADLAVAFMSKSSRSVNNKSLQS
jgi:D-arabinose 5-phosphate isomerase GutQ